MAKASFMLSILFSLRFFDLNLVDGRYLPGNDYLTCLNSFKRVSLSSPPNSWQWITLIRFK